MFLHEVGTISLSSPLSPLPITRSHSSFPSHSRQISLHAVIPSQTRSSTSHSTLHSKRIRYILQPFHFQYFHMSSQLCKAPLGEQEDEEDRGRDGRTTSKSGQAWTSQRHKGRQTTGRSPNDATGYGIHDGDDDEPTLAGFSPAFS